MSAKAAWQLAWCAATQPLASRKALGNREPVHFQTPEAFTRWLFGQPRGAIAPSTVLVVGWAEAKPCMHVIQAARSGDIAKLRPDKGRPQLPEATPGGSGGVTNVAVAEVVIFAKGEMAYRRADKWLREGEYDEHVRISLVSGEDQLQAALLTAFTAQDSVASSSCFTTEPTISQPSFFVHSIGQMTVCRGRDNAPMGARRRWASISSSRARSPSPSDYVWQASEHATMAQACSDLTVTACTSTNQNLVPTITSPRVSSPVPPDFVLEDPEEPWMMACTRSTPAVSESFDARARTPSPDYMWPGFAMSATLPPSARGFRPMGAQETCKVRAPSPDYRWPGFSEQSGADEHPGSDGVRSESEDAVSSSAAADTIVGFVLSV